MSNIKKDVIYRVLIKYDNIYYKIGTIIIKVYSGDIYYSPSQNGISINIDGDIINKKVKKIVFHKSGRVHLDLDDGDRLIHSIGKGIEENINDVDENTLERRQEIKDIGFQDLFIDYIKNFSHIPKYYKNIVPLDIVFNVTNIEEMFFKLNIVSGKILIKVYGGGECKIGDETIKKKNKEDVGIVASDRRCIGHDSGNGDKLMQYLLFKYSGEEIPVDRRIFIPVDSKISNK